MGRLFLIVAAIVIGNFAIDQIKNDPALSAQVDQAWSEFKTGLEQNEVGSVTLDTDYASSAGGRPDVSGFEGRGGAEIRVGGRDTLKPGGDLPALYRAMHRAYDDYQRKLRQHGGQADPTRRALDAYYKAKHAYDGARAGARR